MSTATQNTNGFSYTLRESGAESHTILADAREEAQKAGLPYAGIISPQEAWKLFSRQLALLIDVRTDEERRFVGLVPDSLHVPWMTGTAFAWIEGTTMKKNPCFLRELEAKAGKNDVIVFLCRSGQRSAAAAKAATNAGFQNAFKVDEGFEGARKQGKRALSGGWRIYGLPWVQE